MIRLYFYVEGSTEAAFVNNVLKLHLATRGVMVMGTIQASTGRRHGRVHRGGGRHYAPVREDLFRLLCQHQGGDVRFTTLLDLYALYADFPGMDEANGQKHVPYERIHSLELAFQKDIGDPRLIPHIQLHEFEAILFCRPEAFATVYENAARGIDDLKAVVVKAGSPELIDDGQNTAPSRRIAAVFPQYARNKARDAIAAAEGIPLETIRQHCRHFHEWLTRLEQLDRGT